MNIKKYFAFCFVVPAYGSISIVYNLRVAETSKHRGLESFFKKPSFGIFTPFGTFREKYNGVHHSAGGGLFTLLYSPERYYLRVDAAFARVSSHDRSIHFARTQGDDVLFSGGYSPRTSKKSKLTISGLFGIPTHKDTSLEFVQFGYGHFGLGAQVDGTYFFSTNRNHTFRWATRLIHFFPRNVEARMGDQRERFNYGIGNLADIFLALHMIRKLHSMEAGYDASFFFNAKIFPHFEDAIKRANYIRNSFYGIYKYRFFIGNVASYIACALSYGFEPTPKTVGNKRVITTWASWGINF
ncbi:MAG TPA: hypothetical protein VHO47_00650 [Candidatus Babeliales bacterium]|nr:hypothetical protein [Candidatus Babeliales bacterium]